MSTSTRRRTTPRGWVALVAIGTGAAYAATQDVLTTVVVLVLVVAVARTALWWGNRPRTSD